MSGHKNILLILTDQQRFDTIGALGNSIIRTPAIDSLVKRGVAFTRAYTPCPVCVPARYSMMTGQMPHRTGCTVNGIMPEDRKSLMDILGENGYQTHGVGKMHFTFENEGPQAMWGFQSRDYSEEGGGEDDFKGYLSNNGYEHVHDPQGVRSEMYYIPQPSQLPERHHNTTWVADRSIDFLKRRDKDTPFLLMTSFIKPHPPFESPTPWNKLYRGPEMPLPKRPQYGDELLTYWNRFQNRYKCRDQGIDDNLIRCMKAAYYSAVSFVDYNVGRLLNYMEEEELMDNTLIVFTSDHGELLGDYNCFGKRCFLDSAARIPMILVDPNGPRGALCSNPVSLVDVLPTFLHYAGIEANDDYNGDSMIAIAEGSVAREAVFGQYNYDGYGVYMITTDEYKYIFSAPDNKEWLYDLMADPEETRNRAYNPMYSQIVKTMKNAIICCFEKDGYLAPMEGKDWKRYSIQHLPQDPDACLLFQDPNDSLPDIPGYQRKDDKVFTTGFKIPF